MLNRFLALNTMDPLTKYNIHFNLNFAFIWLLRCPDFAIWWPQMVFEPYLLDLCHSLPPQVHASFDHSYVHVYQGLLTATSSDHKVHLTPSNFNKVFVLTKLDLHTVFVYCTLTFNTVITCLKVFRMWLNQFNAIGILHTPWGIDTQPSMKLIYHELFE